MNIRVAGRLRARAVATLIACAFAATAHGAAPKPVAVISFAGYDALKSDLNFIGELTGNSAMGDSLDGIVALFTRAQGLVGLKKGQAIGAAVSLGDDGQPNVAAFVPVADAAKLLDALQAFVPEVEDAGDDFKKLKLQKGPALYLVEKNGWAFIGQSKDQMGDLPEDPAALLGDLPKKYDLALKVNLANVPEPLVQFALGQIRRGIDESKRPGESDDDFEARKEISGKALDQMVQAIEQIDDVTLGLAVDSKTRSVYFDVNYLMKDGSELAEQINGFASSNVRSKFGGFADSDSLVDIHILEQVAKKDLEKVAEVFEMARKQSVEKIDEGPIEDDETKTMLKDAVGDLIDSAEATLKTGVLNGGFVMQGEGPYSFVLGMNAADGKKVEKAVTKLIAAAKKSPNAPPFEFETSTEEGLSFHTVDIPVPDEDAAKLLGDEVTLAFAFGKDSVFVALGDDPTEDVLAIVEESKQTKPLPPGLIQIRLAPLAAMAADLADDDSRPLLEQAAATLDESEKDMIQLVSKYVENGESVRLEVQEGIIKAAAALVAKAGLMNR